MISPPRLFAPGPVEVCERVRLALGERIYHHRTAEFRAILVDVRERLSRLWQAPGWEPLVLNCSGSGAMEGGGRQLRASRREGGQRLRRQVRRAMGRHPARVRLRCRRAHARLGALGHARRGPRAAGEAPRCGAVFLTSADTSTGGQHPIETLGPAIRAVSDALVPSNALTAVRCGPELDSTRVVDLAQSRYGYRFVNGQDRLKGKIFRIGNMGIHHDADIVGVVHVLECVLADLGSLRCQPGEAVAAAAAHMHQALRAEPDTASSPTPHSPASTSPGQPMSSVAIRAPSVSG